MNLKKTILFVFTFILWSQASAFINVESLRQNHKNGFFGSSNLKVSGASGSTEKIVNNFSTQNIYRADTNEFLFFLDHAYGEAFNEKNTDKGSLHVRYSRSLSKVSALEFYGQVEFNKFRALKLRRIFGTGLRFSILDRENKSLFAGGGAFFENEDLEAEPDEEATRGNFYLAYNFSPKNKVNLSSTLYYQPSLSYNDFRLRSNTSLGFPIGAGFHFVVELKVAHDSAPPLEVEKTDVTYLTGINYSY